MTLVELLVTVTLLGLVAAIAMPSVSVSEAPKVDLAAARLAGAARFARDEALRTAAVHAIVLDPATNTLTVASINLTTDPASIEEVLWHPVSRQPYVVDVESDQATRGVTVLNTQLPFDFVDADREAMLMFDALGIPIFIDSDDNEVFQLADAQIKLGLDGHNRSVRIDPITARVTVQ